MLKKGLVSLANAEIQYSLLVDDSNKWIMLFYTIIPEEIEQINDQIKTVENAETEFYKNNGVGEDTTVVKRFFSSDLINHHNIFLEHKQRQNTDFFMSLIEQPPVSRVKISLLGMCLNNIVPNSKKRRDNVFTFDTIDEDSAYHARVFAPLYGVNEDPVTGTANGAVSSYLVKNGIIKKNKFVWNKETFLKGLEGYL